MSDKIDAGGGIIFDTKVDPPSGTISIDDHPGHPVNQPTPNPNPNPVKPPLGNLGVDGVLELYPTVEGGNEFYLDMNNKENNTKRFNVSFGHGSHLPYKLVTNDNFNYYNAEGSPLNYNSGGKGKSLRLDIYGDENSIWNNKTKNAWSSKPTPKYLHTPKGFKNHEVTGYFRPNKALGTHQALSFKLNGRDEDNIRSLIEFVYPTATHGDVQCNVNFAHFPYVNLKQVKQYFSGDRYTEGKWVGIKVVLIVAPDKQSTWLAMYVDLDPIDENGKPKNNWRLKADVIFSGVKEYGSIPVTWAGQKDVIRIDGFESHDFMYISDREIQNDLVKPAHHAHLMDQKFRYASPPDYKPEDYD